MRHTQLVPLCVPHRVVPPLPPTPNLFLEGAAVAPDGDAWFVGQTITPGGVATPKIFEWNGKRVGLMPLPPSGLADDLRAVAAPADDDAWAVGLDLVLHWNGRAWKRMYFPNGSWWSISASAPDDVWLAGLAEPDLSYAVYHWNGMRWHRVPFLPVASTSTSRSGKRVLVLGGQLEAVLALAPNDVWVAGYTPDQEEFVTHWDGEKWALTAADTSSDYFSFAAPAPTDIWAAGDGATAEFVQGAWHVRTRRPNQVETLVVRRGELWGSRGGMLLRWDGTRWRPLEKPHPETFFNTLAAAPDGSVWGAANDSVVHWVCGR